MCFTIFPVVWCTHGVIWKRNATHPLLTAICVCISQYAGFLRLGIPVYLSVHHPSSRTYHQSNFEWGYRCMSWFNHMGLGAKISWKCGSNVILKEFTQSNDYRITYKRSDQDTSHEQSRGCGVSCSATRTLHSHYALRQATSNARTKFSSRPVEMQVCFNCQPYPNP